MSEFIEKKVITTTKKIGMIWNARIVCKRAHWARSICTQAYTFAAIKQ